MTRVAILTCKKCKAKYNKALSLGGPYRPKLRKSSMDLCPDCLSGKKKPKESK